MSGGPSREGSRKGILCDWDLSRQRKDSKLLDDYEVSVRSLLSLAVATCPSRAGLTLRWSLQATWQFQSIDTLERKPFAGHNHTIQHDMESTLYVVLYCALLYLPHCGGDPASCFERMFDETHTRGGRIEGGDGKSKNRSNGTYTANIEWECSPVTEWLNTVMGYLSTGSKDRWTPDILNEFWGKFLADNQAGLRKDDRCFNIKLLLGSKDRNKVEQRASRVIRGMPLLAPYPYGATVRAGDVRKRGEDEQDDSATTGQPPLKARRIALTPSETESSGSDVLPLNQHHLNMSIPLETLPASVPPTTVSDYEDLGNPQNPDTRRWVYMRPHLRPKSSLVYLTVAADHPSSSLSNSLYSL